MFKGRKSGHLKKVDDRMQYQVERVKSWRFKMRGKDLLTLAWLCFFFFCSCMLPYVVGLASLLWMIDVFLVGTDSGVGIASPVSWPRTVGGIVGRTVAGFRGPFCCCFAIW